MKKILAEAFSGEFVPGENNNILIVESYFEPKSFDVEGMVLGQNLEVVQLNGKKDAYIDFYDRETGRKIILSKHFHRATFGDPGTYAVKGVIAVENPVNLISIEDD